MTPFKPEALHAMEAWKSHAKDLYEGAKLLREKGFPNVAYHLATLTLEELGKAQLIGMQSFAKEDADSWYRNQMGDHVKKLFWALWGDVFGKRPDRQELEQIRGTATIIHNNRLKGLYVDVTEDLVAPRDAVSDETLAPLMTLAEAKLALQPSVWGVEYKQDDLDLLSWFSNVTDDPDKRRFIFSQESFDKMASVGPKEWLTWIRDEVQKSSAHATATLREEMKRGFIEGEEGQQEKWELKIRLFSQSHSIRPKLLNHWNDKVTWLKLYPINGKKDQLEAIIKIPKFITFQAVYYVGFGYSNLLLASLNIASGGLFWWHQPKNLATFFESLLDLEHQMTGKIGRVPELKLGWPHAVLDTEILDQAMALFSMMPQPNEPPDNSEALANYLAGVGLLAKTDVFLQFELQSYGAFLASAKAALRLYRNDLGPEFPADVQDLLSFLNVDNAFKKKHADLIARYGAHTARQVDVTLSEVAEMKRICDGLFTRALNKRLQNRAKDEGTGERVG